ncbi:loganic acid O-methyltransferase-like [Hibiscus syriacus]|uniref:loganic acid O-methyltransferase-like n=1 Tax=Hibiscus syriacus TaxID=106335 RepID=UPI0019208BCC|nr:loganic acid O-methyltransferase-like [Hibiscus syriacus]
MAEVESGPTLLITGGDGESERRPRPDSLHVNGGDGAYSYTRNSYFLIWGVLLVRIPTNTMQHIIHFIQQKYSLQCPKSDKTLEFLVFFNEQPSNDFNTLFKSLPREIPYFAAGVPGSFHCRLFPASSIHFAHCWHAVHWLSKEPEELLDKNSSAWNKGRIHYTNASDEVVRAYAAQFAKDMDDFLCARATEIVSGGMMVISMLGIPNEMPYSQLAESVMFEFPIYTPSLEDMAETVEKNGQFSIEILELINSASLTNGRVDIKAWVVHVRAAMEGMFIQNFSSDIDDEMFDRLTKKLFMFSERVDSGYKDRNQLLVVLIRK